MLKVVIVEDEELLRKGLVFTFNWQAMGCVVIGEADNGLTGQQLIERLKPDIVITDIKMPKMDGLSMLSQLKHLDFESLVMSGFEEFDYAKRALELKVTKYLTKPIDESELRSALMELKPKIEIKRQIKHMSQEQEPLLADLNQPALHYDAYTQKAIRFIQANYASRIRLSDVADAAGVSVGYISKVFKETTSYSINDYLNRFRITKALEYLQSDEYKLFEIANLCGFSEYKYFHHVFTHYLNCAPNVYYKRQIFKP